MRCLLTLSCAVASLIPTTCAIEDATVSAPGQLCAVASGDPDQPRGSHGTWASLVTSGPLTARALQPNLSSMAAKSLELVLGKLLAAARRTDRFDETAVTSDNRFSKDLNEPLFASAGDSKRLKPISVMFREHLGGRIMLPMPEASLPQTASLAVFG